MTLDGSVDELVMKHRFFLSKITFPSKKTNEILYIWFYSNFGAVDGTPDLEYTSQTLYHVVTHFQS